MALVDSEGIGVDIATYRPLGAPIVFRLIGQQIEWWSQAERPVRKQTIPVEGLEAFFKQRKKEFAPEVVYRAKTRGRLDQGLQLDFVDIGLMPLVEREIGSKLARLVERLVDEFKEKAGWPRPSAPQERVIIRSTFGLLAGKILHDKLVPGFGNLDLSNADEVLRRVQKHYGASDAAAQHPEHKSLMAVAKEIARYASLNHVTTEALAEVYESSLITQETRRALGVHSTPSWLVDYFLWRLEPWITELAPEQRTVFEPACGQAAFLVAAMRLLRELLPGDYDEQRRAQYLRQHLLGMEVDPFALELARLSLTLADIPNPNGWRLDPGDMFSGDSLEIRARESTVVVANPPFEAFAPTERKRLRPQNRNQAIEMFRRTLGALQPGAMFGVVLPRSFLDNKETASLRRDLTTDFELQEITLLPDKVFRFSDMECAVLLGRRPQAVQRLGRSVLCRWVREKQVDEFRRTYRSDEGWFPQEWFVRRTGCNLLAPQLNEVWAALEHRPTLTQLAEISEGLSFNRRPGITVASASPFAGGAKGFLRFERKLQLHTQPAERYLNLESAAIRIRRAGDGGRPQVLMNRIRVARGPWRIKAFLDQQGHACTDAFNVVRPRSSAVALEYIWAVLNSPVVNAYVYTHSWRRHNSPGVVGSSPVPDVALGSIDLESVVTAVRGYLQWAHRLRPGTTRDTLTTGRLLLLRVDSALLRLYGLPPRLERMLLDFFSGYQREGVPFDFDRYFPADFTPWFSLHDYLSPEYRQSTVGELLRRPRGEPTESVKAALARAVDAFEE